MTSARVGASFRDPDGVFYLLDGAPRRQLHASYASDWALLHSSGLLDALWRADLLIPHREVSLYDRLDERAVAVIAPDQIPFISYPYEWSQSQLLAAAQLTLQVQLLALQHGMALKDASAFNVQFIGAGALFIDTLSFAAYVPGTPWAAYRQFCQHFLGPLALMRHTDVRLRDLSRTHIDGPPLDLVSRLLPRSTWLQPSLLAHIHLHARGIAQHAESPRPAAAGRGVTRDGLQALLEHLQSSVAALTWQGRRTEWGGYGASDGYSAAAQQAKEAFVRTTATQHRPRTAFDLGANTGRYSELVADSGAQVTAIDGDAGAIEALLTRLQAAGRTDILPLWVDLTNPSPSQGWAHDERMSLEARGPADLVLALALVHHLAIGNNLPLDAILAFLMRLGHRVVIEWVPKSDPQAQRLLVSREDIFTDYTEARFVAACEQHGRIEAREALPESARILFTVVPR
ncbi:MAG: SAM-dependent methyltransferase [Gemmatimonadota bacterium]